MMEACDWSQCDQLAQWQIEYPDHTMRRLCAKHKDELVKMNNGPINFKAYFCGAMPKGVNITKPS